MNENERKFFLKRFFSFNVSTNIPSTGSNNASFDENDELVNINTQPVDSKEKQVNTEETINDNLDSNPINSTTMDLNKKKLDKMNEKLDKGKLSNYDTVNRRNKFKKSTDSTRYLITHSNASELPTSDYSLNESCKSEVPQISKGFNKSEVINSMTLNVEKPGKLQEQYSIELKPFKKKEVHIDVESTNYNNYKTFETLGSPLLMLSLTSNETKILTEPLNDANKNVLNYPSIENLATSLSLNKIKYRLVEI